MLHHVAESTLILLGLKLCTVPQSLSQLLLSLSNSLYSGWPTMNQFGHQSKISLPVYAKSFLQQSCDAFTMPHIPFKGHSSECFIAIHPHYLLNLGLDNSVCGTQAESGSL